MGRIFRSIFAGGSFQAGAIAFVLAMAVYFALNAVWTVYRGPAFVAEIVASLVLGPLFVLAFTAAYHRLFGSKDA